MNTSVLAAVPCTVRRSLFFWGEYSCSYIMSCVSHADTRPNAEAVDKAIKSLTFWAMVRATSEIAYQAEFIGRWSEGCFCHELELTGLATDQDCAAQSVCL